MAMEVGISALMQGDGVLRTQNLKEKKKRHFQLVLKPLKPADARLKTLCGIL